MVSRSASSDRLDRPGLPKSKKWLVDGFCRFTKRMVAKHFHSFGVQWNQLEIESVSLDRPVVVFANHAGWWDPITAMLIRQRFFPDRIFYAPIDSDALENYRIMKQLGFYGLRLNTHAGASEFLAVSKSILTSKKAALFITPEGRFADVRDYGQPLMPGLSHLATRHQEAVLIPLAIEYAFWDESRPQVFARLGPIVTLDGVSQGSVEGSTRKGEWALRLEQGLRETQRQLAASVIAREKSLFEPLIASKPRSLGLYDHCRSWAARLQGKKFDPRHSDKG
jgi:1-acyl-sn-glycerol-3-phosphate acyltransferase